MPCLMRLHFRFLVHLNLIGQRYKLFPKNAVALVPASGSSCYGLFQYLASLPSVCSPYASAMIGMDFARLCNLIGLDAIQTITTGATSNLDDIRATRLLPCGRAISEPDASGDSSCYRGPCSLTQPAGSRPCHRCLFTLGPME